MKRLKSAFTMAEILIALTIIGVIAVLTLPALNGDIEGKQFSVTFRKTLAAMNQAVSINAAETGIDFSGSADTSFADVLDQIFVRRMGGTLEGTINRAWQIMGSSYTGFPLEKDGLNGSNPSGNEYAIDHNNILVSGSISQDFGGAPGQWRIYTMKDGLASIIILGELGTNNNFNCNDEGQFYLGPNGGYARHYCLAYIDVNGPKGPNTLISCVSASDNTANGELRADLSVGDCLVTTNNATDVYPVLLYGSKIVPATRAGIAVYQDKMD